MEKLIEQLNAYMANLAVLHRKLQNYHWNVTGPQFFTLHAKLEEYYTHVNEGIDVVAEEILKLQGEPLGTMASYLKIATLKEAENKKISADAVAKSVIADFTTMKKQICDIKAAADAANVYEVSTMADDFIAEYSKAIWMLRQSQE
ncbi:Dps family protein [Megasphaera lornae]|jgi:putative DNA protection during starvation protein 1|uniref:DNA protection during starvation protein 1 n=1 Tax=Megasphaera lornae TaxID=1000568 RepID=A0ABN0CYY9_9FIRM|nr:DNA starvation/stationary phase protection protein [Megasphaera lornae]EGL39534.1 DNA protection during starvation protein 1 [Megasphaera lornae]KXB93739.1 putative DNA protection during starvation protein 1 [Veillonellaceae bacterium DNF00751]